MPPVPAHTTDVVVASAKPQCEHNWQGHRQLCLHPMLRITPQSDGIRDFDCRGYKLAFPGRGITGRYCQHSSRTKCIAWRSV